MPTRKEIIKKINRLHWVWFWSGNWPRLDALTERDDNFERGFLRLVGVAPRITVDIFKQGIITAYHCQEEYDRLAAYLDKRFKKNSNFILQSLLDYERKTRQDLADLKKLVAVDIRSLTNTELLALFAAARKLLVYNSVIDHWAWYIEKFFMPLLEQRLGQKLSSPNRNKNLVEYLAVLVAPTKPSQIYQERIAFYHLVKKACRVKRFQAAIRNHQPITRLTQRFPAIKKQIQEHTRHYGWLSVLVNNSATTEHDLWQELIAAINQLTPVTLDVKRLGDNFDQRIIKKKKKLLRSLALDTTTMTLIKSLERTAFVRTEDNAVTSHSSFLIIPLYNEIARRLHLTYYELKELTPEEIIQALHSDKSVKKIIKSRHRLGGYVVYKGARLSFDGKDAKTLSRLVEKKLSLPEKQSKVYGTAASFGVASGRAFIAMSSEDCNNFKLGDILVAPATSADFVPAMRKAAAIVTDLGGLTSHAAIIAREFGIPCIVGTKIATKVFKTGDTITVNANKGVVTKA